MLPNYANYAHHLWLSFSVHQHLNALQGVAEYTTYAKVTESSGGMPANEVSEFHKCRHSFPNVPQLLYPSVRPDGLPGQFLHLTQIPFGIGIDPSTGLSKTHQILIRFDSGYQSMTKVDVQEAAIARFEAMGMKLSNRFREPVVALVHPQTKTWLGFIKVDLLNPSTDGIALLKGTRLFTLQLENSSYVIGKVEKAFEFPSTATNRKVLFRSPSLTQFTSRELLSELTRLSYIGGTNLEFVGVTKRTKDLDYAEITVASDKTRQYLLNTPIEFANHKLSITLPSSSQHTNKNSPDALTLSLLVRGLPVYRSQQDITAALHNLLGPNNVHSISFNRAEGDHMDRHDGVATIRCLNSSVYTQWYTKKATPCLGKFIDFAPHPRSLKGSKPHATAKKHDERPTREVIAEAITAFKNETPSTPTLSQFKDSMHEVEDRLKTHISSLGTAINSHTTDSISTVVTQQQQQHTHLARQLEMLTSFSRDYSLQIGGIFSALNKGPSDGPSVHAPSLLTENTHLDE